MSESILPSYCQQCSWLFSKMGACQPPNTSIIFSYISFIPYLLIFLFLGLSLILRGNKQIKIAVLMVSAYILADRILKNIIMHERPEGACKKSFGFPSSHMVVISCYAFEMFINCRKSQKIFLMLLVLSQAFARVNLKYHCWYQVMGGILFALVYTFVFNK